MELLDYFERVRERTMRVMAVVPPERIDWTYQAGKFTIGDIGRHLAAIERWMFAENALLHPSAYPGHGRELADGYDAVVEYMKRMHAEAMEIFRALDESRFDERTMTPGGRADPRPPLDPLHDRARDPPPRAALSLSRDARRPDSAALRPYRGAGEGAERAVNYGYGA